MKQAKTTARLIRTCDTCAHPYYTPLYAYIMIQLHYYSSVAACIVGTQADIQYTTVVRVHVPSTYIFYRCLLYTSPSPRDKRQSRMPSSA